MKLSLRIVLVGLLFLLNHQTTNAKSFSYQDCSTSTFTPSSSYQKNLNTLLSQLATAAGKSTNGYGNNTVGESTSNAVYGVFFCRGDINNDACLSCVLHAITDRLDNTSCLTSKTVLWGYDECMLQYTGESIFSKLQLEPSFRRFDPTLPSVSNATQFADVLRNTASRVIPRVVTGGRDKKFAVAKAPLSTSFPMLCMLAQCTPDLSNADCNECLTVANDNLPQGKQEGRVITPSCSIRFDVNPFYNESTTAWADASAPAAPPDLVPNPAAPPELAPNPASPAANAKFDDVQPFIVYHDIERFIRFVNDTLNGLAAKIAANGGIIVKMFEVAEVNYVSRTLYALAQCIPLLSQNNCSSCLMQSIKHLNPYFMRTTGARVLNLSCNVRFEFCSFYDTSVLLSLGPAPAPASPAPLDGVPPTAATVARAGRKISTAIIITIVIIIAIGVVLILIRSCFSGRKATIKQPITRQYERECMSNFESLQFDLSTIRVATNNFAIENKLGEGGFGVVYKGKLSNGQYVAVKRLSHSSGQGANEFENEVSVIVKLQHRNLVRLFGFCLEGEEKLLVYEFVPNKSLDFFLFDSQKKTLLDWNIRYKILIGIAKGILYLHEDSRLRIIHRDLKASNVLLDNEMNPKISDFGMAKIFGVNQLEGNTNRVVGTYGYMAPEYAMQGQYSVKIDVYSFGILLLEIISGKRSNYLCQSDCIEILPSFAWKHWRNDKPLEVVDPLLRDSFERSEAIRCIHIGLLCVQENPVNRPTMATVVNMLNRQTFSMETPREPAFFFNNKRVAMASSSSKLTPLSVNKVSITELYPR